MNIYLFNKISVGLIHTVNLRYQWLGMKIVKHVLTKENHKVIILK